jgi:16S rRNA (guanine(966)-N(2))-methyltransferase RsmD
MRIIAGSHKGRKLTAPEGLTTRPTSDFVKESMFNLIQFLVEDSEVLDLYSGSGQLGLEALSRGAKSAVFVDSNPKATAVAVANAQVMKVEDQCKFVTSDALSYIDSFHLHADVIFLDPPYAAGLLKKTLNKLFQADIVRSGGIILCEFSREEEAPAASAPYTLDKVRNYGHTRVALYSRQPSQEGDKDVFRPIGS